MAGINLVDLGIDPNCAKKALLYTAVDLLEKNLYFQNKANNIKHNGKAVRAELMSKLENQSVGNLLDLCQKLTTLNEVYQLNSARFNRLERNKPNGSDEDPYGF